jgi:hypothetical protein
VACTWVLSILLVSGMKLPTKPVKEAEITGDRPNRD